MRKHIPWAHLLINLLPYLAILFLLISALLFSQWIVYEHRISAVLNDEQAVWKSATDASCFLSDTVFPMDRHTDSLVFAEDSYLYEYTNGQTRIRCTKTGCLHQNESDPMKCSAYVPEIRFLQFYDSDLYYIIKVSGAPILFREAKDGTRTALGKLPDGEDLRYAIHRHRFYLFDLSDKGTPCSVKRVRLDHFGWYTEDVVILEDAHTIEPKLFAADLCLFIEKQDGSQELRSIDLLTLEQTCFLENTDPTVRYRFSDLDAYHITLLQNKVKNGKIIDTEIWHLRRESGAFSYSLPQTSFLELGEITLAADVPIGFLCLHKTADGTIFRFEPDSAIDPPYEPFFLPVENPTVYRQDDETLVIVSPDGRIFRYRNGGMVRLR